MNDFVMRGKIKACAIKYSDSISIVDNVSVAARSSLVKWMFRCGQQPDQVAAELQPYVVWDPSVQNAGVDAEGHSLVTDVALQGAVEAAVNKQNS